MVPIITVQFGTIRLSPKYKQFGSVRFSSRTESYPPLIVVASFTFVYNIKEDKATVT